MKGLFTILLLSISLILPAQDVYWADTVLEVSSENRIGHHSLRLFPNAYKAVMALGKPNVLPGNEGTSKVWQPKRDDDEEWIKVGFKNPVKVKQIAISEVFNPTAISDIYLYATDGEEIHIQSFEPKILPISGRLLLIFIDQTEKPINAIKVVIDGSKVPGKSGIDAIGISGSWEPVEIFAKIAEGIHTAVAPEKMDSTINSPYKDLKPLLSPDGNTMFFSRINHPLNIGGEDDLEDIWISQRDPITGQWGEAYNAGPVLNNEGPNFIASITPAGYTYQLLLGNKYLPNGKMIDGVSMTVKTDGGFTSPENINIMGYQNFSQHANFYLGADGKTLLMAVHREDTHGDRDLYVSFIGKEGNWSVPLNLGEVVNSGEEESAPFLALDGKTLYFSSKGHLGYGKNDVFVTRRLDDTWTNWTVPENLGTAVNSDDDEMFFFLSESDNKYAYFTRGTGDDADIYRLLLPLFQLPDPVIALQGRVLNKKTGEPVGDARITFRSPEQRVIIDRQYSEKETGKYRVRLPIGLAYELYANAEGYITLEHDTVDLSAIYEPDTIEMDIFLEPVRIGQRIPLDNIYFDFDKATLRPESIPQLELIREFMEENPDVKIELDGHTCTIGNEDYNKSLSEDRALSVRTYLVENGIRRSRIKSVGFGESNPIADNTTAEGREANRRVEFVILEQ